MSALLLLAACAAALGGAEGATLWPKPQVCREWRWRRAATRRDAACGMRATFAVTCATQSIAFYPARWGAIQPCAAALRSTASEGQLLANPKLGPRSALIAHSTRRGSLGGLMIAHDCHVPWNIDACCEARAISRKRRGTPSCSAVLRLCAVRTSAASDGGLASHAARPCARWNACAMWWHSRLAVVERRLSATAYYYGDKRHDGSRRLGRASRVN